MAESGASQEKEKGGEQLAQPPAPNLRMNEQQKPSASRDETERGVELHLRPPRNESTHDRNVQHPTQKRGATQQRGKKSRGLGSAMKWLRVHVFRKETI